MIDQYNSGNSVCVCKLKRGVRLTPVTPSVCKVKAGRCEHNSDNSMCV
jgi:hypothetical protein